MGKRAREIGGILARWLVMGGLLALLAPVGSAVAQGQEPVKIGFIYPDSGPFAQLGLDMRDGFLLYWSEVGHRAAGRAVELFLEAKGTSKADEGLTKARKLVERDKVHLLGGVVSSPVAYALRPYVIENKIPLILTNAGAIGLTQHQRTKYIFRSANTSSQASYPLGDWAYKEGYRKAVMIASDFVAGHEIMGAFARVFTDAGGQIIQEIYPPLGALDFAPYLAQVRRDADVLSVFFAGADALRFVTQYAEYGLKGKTPLISNVGLTDEAILPRQGDAALGIVTSWQWTAALETPANKRFIEGYTGKYKRAATTYAEQGYVGAQMIAQALEAVKGKVEDQEAFMAALRRVEVDAPRGKVKLDDFQNPVQTYYIRRVEKKGGALQNTVIASYPNVSQFWKWTPEAFLTMPLFPDLKGKWAK